MHIATNAVGALGKGFDVDFETRLSYRKGVTCSRIGEIDEEHRRDVYCSSRVGSEHKDSAWTCVISCWK
ncbi:hypothetical protein V6N13_013456 [Hibiscus sabdariffa]|uniref:Uncharacterized protein n=1 Tax=Hibiscus sabdariffa TaxID=183260 RepID=A0ABR2P240_9ROSI